jgi:hypothetical protein
MLSFSGRIYYNFKDKLILVIGTLNRLEGISAKSNFYIMETKAHGEKEGKNELVGGKGVYMNEKEILRIFRKETTSYYALQRKIVPQI